MILTWCAFLVFAQAEVYEPLRVLQFADHLFTMEEYDAAANEYQRYLFLSNNDADSIYVKIVDCYSRLEQWHNALRTAGMVSDPNRKNYLKGWLFFLAGSYDSSRVYLSAVDKPNEHDARTFVGLGFAYEFRFREAGNYIDLPGNPPRHKSPVLGGICSLIPGGGQLYGGRVGDAIYAFIVVAGTSFIAYHYYDQEEDLKFGFSLGVAILFYAGNIYGGINAVRNYNHYQNIKYLTETIECVK